MTRGRTGPEVSPPCRTIVRREGGEAVAALVWAADGEGTMQILHVGVAPEHRRRGHATALLAAAAEEAREHCAAGGVPLRRLWCVARQADHVAMRAVLTMAGYQHLATVAALFPGEVPGQDGLVYVRTFD